MNKKYHVILDETERKAIQEIMHNENTPKSIRKRCDVLLHADEHAGKPATQEELSVRCGMSTVTVHKTIKGWDTQGIEYCLRRRHHETPPRTPIVTGEIEARIIALACGASPEGRCRWTVRLLAEKVVELGILDAVSYETIRTTLKKHNLNLT